MVDVWRMQVCSIKRCHYHDVSYRGHCSKNDKVYPFDVCCLHQKLKERGGNRKHGSGAKSCSY